MNHFCRRLGVVALVVSGIAGCGIVPSQAEYERVAGGKELEVPPGFDQPSRRGVPIPEVTGEVGQVGEKPRPLEEEEGG